MRTRIALLGLILAGCAVRSGPSPNPSPTPPLVPPPSSPTAARADPTITPSAPPAGPLVFELAQPETTARFVIEERLRNRPNIVVGESLQVAGSVVVDPADADQASLGQVTIDAGSFVTDDELRDSSIRGLILESALYPTIVFEPTALLGLPATAAAGDQLTFEAAGDLTIRHITRPIVFRVQLRVESFDRLRGEATAALSRADFELTIPSVPNVAEVADQVELRLVFLAVRLR